MTLSRPAPSARVLAPIALLGLLFVTACTAQGDVPLASPPAQSSTPSPIPDAEVAPAFRALGEPIAQWECTDLIPMLDGETGRAVPPTSTANTPQPTIGVDGDLRCVSEVEVIEGSGSATMTVSVVVADFEDQIAAEGALRNAVCCYQGALIVDSEPPRRFACGGGVCAASVAIKGFVGSVLYQWNPAEIADYSQGPRLDSSVEQLVSLLDAASRPRPLEPLAPDAAPLTRCDEAPGEVSSAVGIALGSNGPARAEFDGSDDGLWIQAALEGRRGTTFCRWTADDAEPAASVIVTPGAGSFVGSPGSPLDSGVGESDPSAFAFDIDGNAIEVYGVDRATAEAIAEAHRR